jgi:MFS family permease
MSALASIKSRFGSFDRRLYILSLGWLVTSAGFALVIPFMSIYFHQELGVSMSAIGLFFGLGAILRAVPQPFAGWLSDRLGRVPIMGWSLVIRSISFAAVGYAIVTGSGFFTIAAILSLNYLSGAVLHPASNAMVADLVKKEQRIQAFAMLRIADNLGWAIGPALGGFIAHHSYSALFFVAGLVSLFSGVFFLSALKDVKRARVSEAPEFKLSDIFNLRRDGRLYEYCLISMALFLAVAQLIVTLSVYSIDTVGITQAELGILYTLNGLMVVFLQYPVSSLLKRRSLTWQLTFGAIIYAIGYFLVGLVHGLVFLLVCMVIITLAEIIVSPPSVTMVANLSPPGRYGRYMGVFGFFQTAGWSLGPTVGGALMDAFAGRTMVMWSLISLLALISSVLYINFGRKLPRDVNSGRKTPTEVISDA